MAVLRGVRPLLNPLMLAGWALWSLVSVTPAFAQSEVDLFDASVTADVAEQSLEGSRIEIIRDPNIVLDVPASSVTEVDVYIDDMLANDFVTVRDGMVTLAYPFVNSEEPFTVEVRARKTGEALKRAYLRFETNPIFDNVDYSFSLQSDTIFQPFAESQPDDTGLNTTKLDSEFRAEGTVRAERGPYFAGVTVEAVGTTVPEDRLNFDGPAVDLSRWMVEGGVDDQARGYSAGVQLGDVTIDGVNELVNVGLSSRGVRLYGTAWDQRIRLNGGSVFGTDVFGTRRDLGIRDGNRRTSANFTIEAIRLEKLTIRLLGSLLDAKRPAAQNFEVVEAFNGETNRVYGAGVEVEALDGRITARSNFAHNEYANPVELDPELADFGGQIDDVGTTRDEAHRHRVDVTVYEGELAENWPIRVTAYGGYAVTGALYRSVQAFVEADRETIDVGGVLSIGPIQVSVDHNRFDNNIDDVPGILKTRQKSTNILLNVDLEQYRYPDGGGAGWKAIPSSLSLSAAQFTIDPLNRAEIDGNDELSSFNGSEIPEQETLPFTLDLGWQWDSSSTNLSLFRSTLDNKQDGRQDADTTDQGFEISHEYNADVWDLGGRFRFNEFEDEDPALGAKEKRYALGANAGLRVEELPDFSIFYEFDVTDSNPTNDDDNSTTQFNHRVSSTLEFAKFLPEVFREHDAYANATVQWNLTDTDQSLFDDERFDNVIVNLTIGFRFSL